MEYSLLRCWGARPGDRISGGYRGGRGPLLKVVRLYAASPEDSGLPCGSVYGRRCFSHMITELCGLALGGNLGRRFAASHFKNSGNVDVFSMKKPVEVVRSTGLVWLRSVPAPEKSCRGYYSA